MKLLVVFMSPPKPFLSTGVTSLKVALVILSEVSNQADSGNQEAARLLNLDILTALAAGDELVYMMLEEDQINVV